MRQNSDFTQGSIACNIMRLAVPMIFAQIINVLYSVVDRMYIGHLPAVSASALTGIGLTFPIISMITAFANLYGSGGAPIFAIARGRGDEKDARHVMGCTFMLLILTGAVLTAVILCFKQPLLYLFGASHATFPYASSYLTIYLAGSIFAMVSLGMNGFINAQGFATKGMTTVLLGALLNLVLDPVFIFVLDLGVAGAALATVISQCASALWVVSFLSGKKALIRLSRREMRLRGPLVKRIMLLGFSGFIMNITNSGVQIVCNATLKLFGGDLYVGAMTIIHSVREIAIAPLNGFGNATQPVFGYNFGAQEYGRVRQGIRFLSVCAVLYTTAIWLCILCFPMAFVRLFSESDELRAITIPALQIYFFGFFMMALQNTGQLTAVALGKSKQAIFFSLFRKAIIVMPLTLFLPRICGLGVKGVFLAEPISNFIGGGACYLTMLLTIWRELARLEREKMTI